MPNQNNKSFYLMAGLLLAGCLWVSEPVIFNIFAVIKLAYEVEPVLMGALLTFMLWGKLAMVSLGVWFCSKAKSSDNTKLFFPMQVDRIFTAF